MADQIKRGVDPAMNRILPGAEKPTPGESAKRNNNQTPRPGGRAKPKSKNPEDKKDDDAQRELESGRPREEGMSDRQRADVAGNEAEPDIPSNAGAILPGFLCWPKRSRGQKELLPLPPCPPARPGGPILALLPIYFVNI